MRKEEPAVSDRTAPSLFGPGAALKVSPKLEAYCATGKERP